MTAHGAFPTRAREAVLTGGEPVVVSAGADRLELQPLTIERTALLYSAGSPLLVADPPLGIGVGWCVSLRIASHPDPRELTRLLAEGGVAALARDAMDFFSQADSFAIVERGAEALRAEWRRLDALDPDDRADGTAKGDLGNADGPGTAGSPPSSATQPPTGAGPGGAR